MLTTEAKPLNTIFIGFCLSPCFYRIFNVKTKSTISTTPITSHLEHTQAYKHTKITNIKSWNNTATKITWYWQPTYQIDYKDSQIQFHIVTTFYLMPH